jgi:hypothetical protein
MQSSCAVVCVWFDFVSFSRLESLKTYIMNINMGYEFREMFQTYNWR